MPRATDTIMLQPYPVPQPEMIDAEAVAEMEWVMNFINGVRQIRSGMNIAPGKLLPVLLQNCTAQDESRVETSIQYLISLARLESITVLEPDAEAPESATALIGEVKLLIPMAGLINKQAELARLTKEMDKLHKEVERGEIKLANPSYVERAPADVVEKERQRVSDMRSALEKLEEQRKKIEAL